MGAMLACGLAYVRFGLENPEHYRILFMGRAKQTPASFGAERLQRSASFEHMIEAVQAGIDAGVLRQGDARLMSMSLWATAHGIVSLMIAMPSFPWPDPLALAEHLLHIQGHALLTKEARDTHEHTYGELSLTLPGLDVPGIAPGATLTRTGITPRLLATAMRRPSRADLTGACGASPPEPWKPKRARAMLWRIQGCRH